MRIQHNISAMSSYRNYTNNTSALAKNLEKLSSGYKINRAGDDAAGLAISEKMRAQISGLEQAQANAKSGINLVQTAEGAMTEIHDMLNRMVTLADQSANGTFDNDVDRVQLQKEVNQLRDEINRIADSANFNGIKLLDGSLDTSVKAASEDVSVTVLADGQLGKEPQAGVYSIDFSDVSIVGTDTGATVNLNIFGQDLAADISVSKGKTLTGEELAEQIASSTKWNTTLQGTWNDEYGFKMTAKAEGSKVIFTMSNAPTKDWATAVGAATGELTINTANGNNAQQVTVTVEKEAVDTTHSRMYGQASFELSKTAGKGKVQVVDGSTVTIGNETYVFALGAGSKYKDMENVIDLTDKTKDSADLIGVAAQRLSTAAKDNDSFKVGTTLNTGVITVTEKEGAVDYSKNNLAGKDGIGSKGITVAGNVAATATDWAGLIRSGTVDTAKMGNSLTLQIGDTAESFNQMKVSIGDMHANAMGIGDIDISTQEGAAAAVEKIKNAVNYVSDVRGTLGATQNRLDHTINNLSVMQENIQDAESTIRDVDVAEEMMDYTKNSILVQSAQAMLAQANQLPQGVLQLLQ